MSNSIPEIIRAGLRIDVDTYRGTRLGVPRLLQTLDKHQIKATFYFSFGPDNMGRHLWRLLKPAFFVKMLKSKAANLYGWDILLRGTLWPGPVIADAHADIIRATAEAGHEIGVHAWDHHRWQRHVDTMRDDEINQEIRFACDKFKQVLGYAPKTSAAAGWKCPQSAALAKENFEFEYNSDCRGDSIFIPMLNKRQLAVQIPVTLPTYDEVIGRDGVDNDNFNNYILKQITPNKLNVYTIHAEVEGIVCADLFDAFLTQSALKNIQWTTLKSLLPQDKQQLPLASIQQQALAGREGSLCQQVPLQTP